MNQAEDLITSILRRNNIPLRAPSSGETPNVPRPEDVDTGNRTRIFKGIKQITFEEYTNLTEEERKQYVFFVRESAEATFGFVGIGNLKYTMVPEDIRGLDCGYFDCSGETPDTGSTTGDTGYTPDTGSTTGDTGDTHDAPYGLIFDFLEDGLIILQGSAGHNVVVSYTLDSGATWTEIQSQNIPQITVLAGDRMYVRGTNTAFCGAGQGQSWANHFSGTAKFNVHGNLMYLLYDDQADAHTELESYQGWQQLFIGSRVVDASGLIMPDNVTVQGFSSMFANCPYLTQVPDLPALNVPEYGYVSMFQNCPSLVTPPTIAATSAARYGFNNMFNGCTGLQTIPEIHVLSAGTNTMSSMFQGCTGLQDLSNCTIHTTAFTDYACWRMFYECTNLTKTPQMSVVSTGQACFRDMFLDCSALTEINVSFGITQIAGGACNSMFKNCVSLEYANIAGIRNITGFTGNGAFANMFEGCTNLIKLGSSDLTNVLSPSAVYMSAYQEMFKGCTSLNGCPTILATSVYTSGCTSMFEGCTSLATIEVPTATTVQSHGYESMYKGCTGIRGRVSLVATNIGSYAYAYMFSGCTGIDSVGGWGNPSCVWPECVCLGMFKDCTSFESYANFTAYNIGASGFTEMFANCTSLTVSNFSLAENTVLADSCCSHMFDGCTSLRLGPALEATELAPNCYSYAFANCTSLETSQALRAETLVDNCYSHMFSNCVALGRVICLARDISATDCAADWLSGTRPGGRVQVADSEMVTTWRNSGYIPNDWDIVS